MSLSCFLSFFTANTENRGKLRKGILANTIRLVIVLSHRILLDVDDAHACTNYFKQKRVEA